MSEQTPRTRQELYDRIRETSKEEFILEEMVRLGFWAKNEGKPAIAEKLIERSGELGRELNKLISKQNKYKNRDFLLKELRKKRMADAKARRVETKERREKQRIEKAEAWAKKKEHDIIYLGKEVSGGLNNKENDAEKLASFGLPLFDGVDELAKAMKISLGQLRFLAFSRKTSKTTHYKRFNVAKKTGGFRTISAPMPRLKAAQYWILEHVLYKVTSHEAAHGFVPEKSIVSNAKAHVGQEVVINLDLKDFFPSIAYKRVKGMFRALGYSEQIATIFGLLCTEPQVDEVEIDGETYYVAKSERVLPQGAPTSPAVTNIMCYRMDKRFAGAAKALDFNYTRYADDLTFSASGKALGDVGRVLWQSNEIIKDEGFTLHPDKVKVMRKGRRQEVTGIVVNEKISLNRKTLKKFRAVLHKIEMNGIDGVTWGNGHILNTIQGYANYIGMVDAEKGKPYIERVNAILANPKNRKAKKNLKASAEAPVIDKKEVIKPKPEQKDQSKGTDWWRLF